MYSQDNQDKGIALIHIIVGLIIVIVIINILFSMYSAVFPRDDVDIDIHTPGYYYGHSRYKKYPKYSPNYKTPQSNIPAGDSKFQERFSSKTKSSSFSSRFASKFGRSRTSTFRSSGFFGGK